MATVAGNPGEGSFHDPALGQYDESLDANGTQDGLQNPAERLVDPFRQLLSAVSRIAEGSEIRIGPGLPSSIWFPVGDARHASDVDADDAARKHSNDAKILRRMERGCRRGNHLGGLG